MNDDPLVPPPALVPPATSDLRDQLAAAARYFYARGWMAGTAGNLSARESDGTAWITASGRQKGGLERGDFLRFDPSTMAVLERAHPDDRPSAETAIHAAVYQQFPSARACFHVHSVEAALVTTVTTADWIALPPLEMLKGLGVWQEDPTVELALFVNHLDVSRVAAAIRERFVATPPRVPGLLVRHHGLTTWGDTPGDALNHVELFDFIFRYLVAKWSARL